MAARKRRKKTRSLRGLGYEASEHKVYAQSLESKAARELFHVPIEADRGDCDAALSAYSAGMTLLGQSEAHKRSTGGYATLDTVPVGEGTREQIKAANAAMKRCFVPRKGR